MITLGRARPSKSAAETSDPAKVGAPHYEGCLQGVGTGQALGWCRRTSALAEPVRVTIVVDGEIVAEGLADIARPDLADSGSEACGFLIALPEPLQASGRHRVLVLAGPEKTPLEAAPSFWSDAGSSEGWSNVVFEPESRSSGFVLPTVPEPPTEPDRIATVSVGWLFNVGEISASHAPSDTELDRIAEDLASVARTCTRLNIAYIPAIIPSKHQVLGLAPNRGRVPADLTARLRDIDEVELLDLLPVLGDASRHGALFHRTDPDWNDRGGFFVVRALLKEAHKRFPELQAPRLADLHLRAVPDYRGPLANAPKFELIDGEPVPVELEVEAEEGIAVDAHTLRAMRMPVESHLAMVGSTHLRVYANPEQAEDTCVAVVGDSAALALVPWVAERVSRTTFFWTHALPFAQLELEMPQVVFHLIREGDLLAGHVAALEIDATFVHGIPARTDGELPRPGRQ
jgi:SGNH hydrolase-like domain, acetyltransferase AlgX